MIEYNQIAKKAAVFQKNAFENTYNTVARVQDQAAAAVDKLMSQPGLVPEEGRQVIKTWVNACQEERDRFKSYVEEGFSRLENRLAGGSKTAPKAIAKPEN